MISIKYFLQYLIIILLFFIYKVLGLKYSSILSGKIFLIFGRFFRSNSISLQNLSKALSNSNIKLKKEIIDKMWYNYGQIFA